MAQLWEGDISKRTISRALANYSPDLNKIEQCWSWLKSRIRKCRNQFDSLRDAIAKRCLEQVEHILKLAS